MTINFVFAKKCDLRFLTVCCKESNTHVRLSVVVIHERRFYRPLKFYDYSSCKKDLQKQNLGTRFVDFWSLNSSLATIHNISEIFGLQVLVNTLSTRSETTNYFTMKNYVKELKNILKRFKKEPSLMMLCNISFILSECLTYLH